MLKKVILTISVILLIIAIIIGVRIVQNQKEKNSAAVTTNSSSALSSQTIKSITSWLEQTHSNLSLKGSSLLLGDKNTIIYENKTGNYTKNTVIPIASATKWISAAVITSLVDAKILSFDDTAGKYIPSFASEDKKNITLRQLLSHTSGLPGNADCLNNAAITLEQCVDEIAKLPLVSLPGKELNYGGASFQVAGRMAEVAAQENWENVFNKHIKQPLEMNNTSFGNTKNPRIAGGVTSTTEDYSHLLNMYLNCGLFQNQQVISCSSVQQMKQNQTGDARINSTPQPDNRRYGIGQWLDVVEQGETVQSSSQGAFGFSPWIDWKKGYYGVYGVTSTFSKVQKPIQNLQTLLQEEMFKQ